MIESCTKRRMIISTIVLLVLTVLILILEEKLTSDWNESPTPVPQSSGVNINSDLKRSSSLVNHFQSSSESPQECWKLEQFKVVVECSPCTPFERESGSIPACKSGFKETIHCNISGAVFRSCSDVPSISKTRFWIFESLMGLTAIISYGFCRYRTSKLERATIKQIERRLASGM